MSDLPEKPEYDDRPGRDEYGLVMPFVCVTSRDGPYEDVAFVAGYQVGSIDARLADRRIAATTEMLYAPLREQVDLVAMRHGYETEVLREVEDEWLHIGFTRVEEPPL